MAVKGEVTDWGRSHDNDNLASMSG